METRNARHGARSTGIKKLVLVLTLLAVLAIPSGAMAAQPAHSVRGHAIVFLDPPAQIQQMSISASVDANGDVSGMALWPIITPDIPGWIWRIEVTGLVVDENVATIDGIVVFDNRLPEENLGCPVQFIVTDNGSGSSQPPDVITFNSDCTGYGSFDSLGGNFTVR